MSEEDRCRTIRLKLSRMTGAPPAGAIPTGFAALDHALGVGGLPRGAVVELFGPAGCGKTTLAIRIAAQAQHDGGSTAWIDAEHVFDPAYASTLGLLVERMPVLQPDSAEQALDMAHRLLASAAVDLLIVDSAAALVPQLELDSGIGDAGPGLHGRVLASGLRRLSRKLARSPACMLFLNQTRTRRESTGDEVETSAGGAALKLHATVRIGISPVAQSRVCFRILKNRTSGAFQTDELDWKTGAGYAESP